MRQGSPLDDFGLMFHELVIALACSLKPPGGSLDVYKRQHPMRPLLAMLRAKPATPTVKGEVIRTLSLRAPPALFS